MLREHIYGFFCAMQLMFNDRYIGYKFLVNRLENNCNQQVWQSLKLIKHAKFFSP